MVALKTRRTYENYFYFVVICLAIVGLFHGGRDNPAHATTVFELLLMLGVFFTDFRLDKAQKAFLLTATIYIFINYAFFWPQKLSLNLDFIMAYKAFFYIIILSFFSGGKLFDAYKIRLMVKLLIIIFAIKYSYAKFLGIDHRPGVYTENNYELIFIIICFYACVCNKLSMGKTTWVVIAYIIIISGSRSAALAFFLIIAGALWEGKDIKVHSKAVLLFASACMLVVVFAFRMDNIGFHELLDSSEGITVYIDEKSSDHDGGNAIISDSDKVDSVGSDSDKVDSIGDEFKRLDRIKFFKVFLNEMNSYGLIGYAFGIHPLTPLSDSSCDKLSYYSSLFSYNDPEKCYAVILHSFFLRYIHDHGVIGVLFILLYVFITIKRLGYSNCQALVILGVIAASGLSVSSFASVYIALSLSVLFSMNFDCRRN